MFKPKIAVFNGKGIFEIFSGKKEFLFGKQPEKIEGTQTVSSSRPSPILVFVHSRPMCGDDLILYFINAV